MSSEKIDVIILAGGLGTRLKSVMHTLPKTLSPINGRPFLDYILDFLEGSDSVNSVILAVGYMADQIIEKYTNRQEYNFEILFSKEEMLLGTGGAIKKALQFSTTDNVMVLNGDSYVDVDIRDVITFHREKNAAMTIVVKKVGNPGRYGRVEFDKNHGITSFNEKQTKAGEGHINAGIYLFKREIFNSIEENRTISLEKELIPFFINNNDIYGFVTDRKFIDIGIPETYQIADKFFKEESGQK
jgi:Nucleoside-diphosphate-sugar pyrophosphorylase involved in lipopolysaccharide biosynthesis/translation initiation factor 2B, gamma/epsilon subunits (eIF-2Bgamma/eIF-2Bepsilon)